MSDEKRARLRQWIESGEARLAPLTFPQRELWEAAPVPVADVSNHICALIHVRGAIPPEDCLQALRQVAARQEVLRLSFLPGKAQPVQLIRSQGEAVMHFHDLPAAQHAPRAIEAQAEEICLRPFDLLQGPLYRVEALRRAPDDQVWVFVIHHAIADGWTLGAFVQDLAAAYLQTRLGDTSPLPELEMSYSAWGAAERAFWTPAEIDTRTAFWKPRLAGAPRLWDTPANYAPVPRRVVTVLPAELGSALRELARRHGVTLFSTLLAAFDLALARWTRAEDWVVGSPVANRPKQAVRETMGYFAGIVPLRRQTDWQRPFAEALRVTHAATIEAFAHALPFVELVRALGEPVAPGRNPFFQVRFALQNHPMPDVNLRGLSLQLRMRSTGTPRFDLGCEITEQGEALEVVWLSRPAMFSAREMEELGRLFRETLARVSRSPESRSATLSA